MIPPTAAKYREQSKSMCALYEPTTGRIRHMHLTIVLQGGHSPDQSEMEAHARKSLTQRSEPHAHLHALHIPADQIKPTQRYQVDVASKKLVAKTK
ncbi:MAG: hypothetical protein M3O30_18665 [Planctomycetota bacterium]|nr:hypothetical protein [Planctomycetota bacterium]